MSEVFEAIARVIFEIIFHCFIRGPGWLILRMFRSPEDIEPDGFLVFLVGMGFWIVVGIIVWRTMLL